MVRCQQEGKRDDRIGNERAWVEVFDRYQATLGTRPVRRQESPGPPLREQIPRGALGNADEVPNLPGLEAASPEQHGFGETAGNLTTDSHVISNFIVNLQNLQLSCNH